MRTKVFDRIKALFNWIKNHKYIFVTIVFLAIIIVVDDNNMISHIKNKATIDKLTDEIREMEADSAEVQDKLKLYTDGDLSVIEDVARAQGLIKKDEDIYIIKPMLMAVRNMLFLKIIALSFPQRKEFILMSFLSLLKILFIRVNRILSFLFRITSNRL